MASILPSQPIRARKPTVSGLYKIVHIATGKHYVGSASNAPRRMTAHRRHLRAGRHGNKHLQNAWNKHGESAFDFSIFLICRPQDRLFYEGSVLSSYRKNWRRLYNIAYDAQAPHLGRPFSKTQRARHAVGLQAAWANPDVRGPWLAAVKQSLADPNVKARKNALLRAVWADPEKRAQQSLKMKAAWAVPASRARRIAAAKAPLSDPEIKAQRMGPAWGALNDPAILAKRADSIRAAYAKPDTIARLSATRKKQWEEKREQILAKGKATRERNNSKPGRRRSAIPTSEPSR